MSGGAAWQLAARQHGVVSRRQLLDLGLSHEAIQHRLRKGRLHRVDRGVYAVGRPELSQRGHWMAAVLACGPHAALSHGSAAALWGIERERRGATEVSVPASSMRRRRCALVHRRRSMPVSDLTVTDGIPVTGVVYTLIDLAATLPSAALERGVNEADRLDLVDPDELRDALDSHRGRRGVALLRQLLDRRTFRLTDSELERRFLPLAEAAGLVRPLTRQRLNGFRVDFYWPDLGLVVETDGLRITARPGSRPATGCAIRPIRRRG